MSANIILIKRVLTNSQKWYFDAFDELEPAPAKAAKPTANQTKLCRIKILKSSYNFTLKSSNSG